MQQRRLLIVLTVLVAQYCFVEGLPPGLSQAILQHLTVLAQVVKLTLHATRLQPNLPQVMARLQPEQLTEGA